MERAETKNKITAGDLRLEEEDNLITRERQ